MEDVALMAFRFQASPLSGGIRSVEARRSQLKTDEYIIRS